MIQSSPELAAESLLSLHDRAIKTLTASKGMVTHRVDGRLVKMAESLPVRFDGRLFGLRALVVASRELSVPRRDRNTVVPIVTIPGGPVSIETRERNRYGSEVFRLLEDDTILQQECWGHGVNRQSQEELADYVGSIIDLMTPPESV